MSELMEQYLAQIRRALELEARKLRTVTLCLLMTPLLVRDPLAWSFNGRATLMEEAALNG